MAAKTGINEALKHFSNKQYTEALAVCDRIFDPEEPQLRVRILRCRCNQLLENYEQANEEAKLGLKEAEEQGQPQTILRRILCEICSFSKDYQAAIESFEYLLANATKDELNSLQFILRQTFYTITKEGKMSVRAWEALYRNRDRALEYSQLKKLLCRQIGYYSAHVLRELNLGVKRVESRYKGNISVTPAQLNAKMLEVYRASNVDEVLTFAINIDIEDEERRKLEQALLKFNMDQIPLRPKNEKPEIVEKIIADVENMLLFEPAKPEPYYIFWDWTDSAGFAALTAPDVNKFVRLFPSDGLSIIFDAISHSTANPFDFTIEDESKKEKKNGKKDDKKKVKTWSPQTVIEALETGLELCPGVLIAIRLIVHFCQEMQLYKKALIYTESGAHLIEKMQKQYGLGLQNQLLELKTIETQCLIGSGQLRDLRAAKEVMDLQLKVNPDNVEANLTKAFVLVQLKDYDDALEIYQRLRSNHPENVRVCSDMGWCLIQRDELTEGTELLREACTAISYNAGPNEDNPAPARVLTGIKEEVLLWRLGRALYLQREYKEAVERLSAALKYNSSYAPAFTCIGLVLQKSGDKSRAMRYFHKALELDNSQLEAAYHLAHQFAEDGLWDLVGIISTRVLDAGVSESSDGEFSDAWPNRALGFSNLAQGNFTEAISQLQTSIRLDPQDASMWTGLGEAYQRVGRFNSAFKALLNALELEPDCVPARFQLALTMRATGQFEDAISNLDRVIAESGETLVNSELVKTLIAAASYEISTGYHGDAREKLERALDVSVSCIEHNPSIALYLLMSNAASLINQHQFEPELKTKLEKVKNKLQNLGDRGLEHGSNSFWISSASAIAAIKCDTRSKYMKSAGHFDLALSLYHQKPEFSRLVESARQAIKIEPRNAEFWETYGVILGNVNPRAAQHSFAQAISLDSTNTRLWANAASFYFQQKDYELASECTDRALTLQPFNSNAWAISAMVEKIGGNTQKAEDLVEQAFEMAADDETLSKKLHGCVELEKLFETKDSNVKFSSLIALQKASHQDPSNVDLKTWYINALERAGCYSIALKVCQELLESTKQESLHAQLGRLCLALENYSGALNHSNHVLTSESEIAESEVLCALLVNGFASFKLGDFDAAKEMIGMAFEHNKDVEPLYTKILFASDGKNGIENALNKLFENISDTGPSLQQALMIGVLALKSGDEELQAVAYEEIGQVQLSELNAKECYLIQSIVAQLTNSKAPFYRGLLYHPESYEMWSQVSASQALRIKTRQAASSQELSRAYQNMGDLKSQQRAVFYDPSNTSAWVSLAKASTAMA